MFLGKVKEVDELMDDGSRLWIGIVICCALILIMGFFSLCENAAVEFNDSKLKKMAEEEEQNSKAKRLLKLLSEPSRILSISSVSRSVMALIISAVATLCVYSGVSGKICKYFEISENSSAFFWTKFACIVLIIVICALLVNVFGVTIPKRLVTSGKVGEKFILSCCGIYRFWLLLFKPLAAVNSGIAKAILRLLGIKNFNKSEEVTEEEILLMVDAVNETGAIEESQAEMISNVLDFDDLEAREVMTHRTEVHALDKESTVKEAANLAIEEGISRIPVYEENIDTIVGVVFVKDLLKFVVEENPGEHFVSEFMRDILFVPESNSCREVFKEFTEQKAQMAVVVDEYGGTAGIITMEDLLETIVGNIQDEYDNEVEEITRIRDGFYEILGTADYEDVFEELGLTPDEDGEYETIGGFVIDKLGHIPKEGETPSLDWENVRFKVMSAKDNKIIKMTAVVCKERQTEDDENKK